MLKRKCVNSSSPNEPKRTWPIVDDDLNEVEFFVIIYLTNIFNRYDVLLYTE